MLFVMIALAPVWAASVAADRQAYIRRMNSSWAGVLRLWKCEGWQSGNGTLSAWLSGAIERFEKRNPGVYVQMTDVSAETMRAFADGSVNPPDMILYPPGMLEAPYSLMEIGEEIRVREPLERLGLWQGSRYAVPVALGGYALAVNNRLLPDTPADFRTFTLPESGKSGKIHLLNAPRDGEHTAWSAAVISIFAGQYGSVSGSGPAPAGEGMDIGLILPDMQAPPPAEREIWQGNGMPRELPEDFLENESAYAQFTAGKIAAMPVTQREIRRLQLLSEAGKAPDWRVEAMGLPFTDQAALFSVVAWPRDDMKERQTMAISFLNLLLSEEMQKKLTVSRTFSVLDTTGLYPGNPGMQAIDEALRADDLLLPPAFSDEWRAYAASLMRGTGPGGETKGAYELLRQAMEEEMGG